MNTQINTQELFVEELQELFKDKMEKAAEDRCDYDREATSEEAAQNKSLYTYTYLTALRHVAPKVRSLIEALEQISGDHEQFCCDDQEDCKFTAQKALADFKRPAK